MSIGPPDKSVSSPPPEPAEPVGPPPGSEPEAAEARSERVPSRDGYVGVPRSATRIPQIIGAVLIALGVSIVGVIFLSIIDPSVADADLEQPDGIKLAVQAFAVLGFASAAIGMTMIVNPGGLGDALRRLGLGGGGRRLLSTLGFALLFYVVGASLLAALLSPQQEDIAENLGADQDAALLVTVIAGILIIAGAAIGEEIFFRGMLFGGLRQIMPLWPAAAISGVLFGLPHLPQGDAAVVAQLSLFGAVLAWAYDRCGSLWVPIGMHAANNSLAFYLLVTDRI